MEKSSQNVSVPSTRGVRNNNYGNLRHGSKWLGLTPIQYDKSFCQFSDPVYGLRALIITLRTYFNKYRLNTVTKIITRYAPASDGNATDKYINTVVVAINSELHAAITRNDVLPLNFRSNGKDNIYGHDILYVLVKTICKVESNVIVSYPMFLHALDLVNHR